MASTLENSLFASIRDLSFASCEDPPPAQKVPVGRRVDQDTWGQKKNIWQAPRVFEYLSGDLGHGAYPSHIWPGQANVSTSLNAANATQDTEIGAISSKRNQGPATLPSAFSSCWPGSGLPSPTRQRSNGTLIHDSSTTMSVLDRPSLLPGSAPDNESSSFAATKQMQEQRHRSSVLQNPHHLTAEDAEEFVPSYLQNCNNFPGLMNDLNGNPSLSLQHAPTRSGQQHSNGFADTPAVHQQEYSHGSTTYPYKLDNTPRFGRTSATVYGRPSGYTATYNNPAMAAREGATPAYGIRPNQHSGKGHDFAGLHQKSSNLRPDVASYHPSCANTNADPRYNQPNVMQDSNSNGHDYYATSSSIYGQLKSPCVAYVNGNAFSKNSSTRAPGFLRNSLDDEQHGLQSRHSVGAHQAILRHNAVGSDSLYSGPGYVPLSGDRFEVTIPGISTQTHTPPTATHYSSDVTSHAPHTSAAPHQEQPHVDQAVSGMHTCFANDFYSTESGPKEGRSELLEEFRLCHKSRKYELKDIYGHIVEFSGDQNGSRFIQTKLEQANGDEKEQIFTELLTNARQLMTDVFGNYVIQKMFEYGNQSQKKALASQMQGNMMKLSMHAYGCRCVQKALEHILTDQQASLISELVGQVLWVVENQHGNHVIQKAVECVPAEHIQFIVDEHRGHIVRLSKHIYGCRIIQRILEYCTSSTKRMVLDEVHCAIPSLIDDQYGNYVIQCIIKKCNPADRYRVVEYVQRELLFYATHKFASNVVEKAIQFAEEKQRAHIIRTLTGPDVRNGNASPVLHLLKDQYGNYVIQTVLRTIQGPAKKALADEVRLHLSYIGKVSRSKQVTAMNDTLAAVTAGHSPSSISTGPQTPRTPTSLNAGGGMDTPISKAIEVLPPVYTMRESHSHAICLRPLQH